MLLDISCLIAFAFSLIFLYFLSIFSINKDDKVNKESSEPGPLTIYDGNQRDISDFPPYI